ncbi:glycine cleavage system protein GcvH [Candidatus Acetothermia bacterium]|nr:glycine cleavage system protein GcvH [Candidatus Acetothermia bacterium]MBI3642989.1 glycine cleavage system protein GcvH [Candidatus Acetothermia bacterium]
MAYPEKFRYSKEHEWVKQEDGKARMGITNYAQDELGDVVYVELPAMGAKVKASDSFITVESVKAASDVFAPVSGKVVEVNRELESHPELVNQSPHERGWMAVLEMANPDELDKLMTAEEYEEYVGEL